jgi:hypothetical protein
MRILWLPLTMLLALPSYAVDKTVFIPLHYVPAIEVDRSLAPGEQRANGPIGTLAPENRGLVPHGIVAWTVDERRNGLSVTGSEEAIRSLSQIIGLLDVPVRHVRLSVRVVRLDDRDRARLKPEALSPSPPGRGPTDFVAVVTRDQAASLEEREALAAAEMSVASNLPLHLAWPGNLNQQPEPAVILPRVNGDGTVTIYLPLTRLSSADVPEAGQMIVARRIASGQSVLIFSQRLGTALLVNVREDIPAGVKEGH